MEKEKEPVWMLGEMVEDSTRVERWMGNRVSAKGTERTLQPLTWGNRADAFQRPGF